MAKKRSISLDILKGIAIIAISLYHVGGYSPVRIFGRRYLSCCQWVFAY